MAEEARELLKTATTQLADHRPGAAASTANRALTLYLAAGDQEGAAEAIGVSVASYIRSGNIEMALTAARQALASAKKARNTRAEAAAMQAMAQARRAGGEADSAMAAARRAQGLLKELGESINQAKCLQLIATVQFEKGYWELCLKAVRQGIKALGEASTEEAQTLARELETLVAYAHHARGEEPPASSRRMEALQVVQELGKALEERSAEKFSEALTRLRTIGAFTGTDTSRAFAEELEKDPEGADSFLAMHMSHSDFALPGVDAGAMVAHDGYDGYHWSQLDFCCLRTFPSPLEKQTGSLSGNDGEELTWQQSMGQLTIYYQLRNGPVTEVPGGWTQDDITVEISKAKLRVSLGGQPLKFLTGEFLEDVWRKDSWWHVEQDEARLVIHLSKRESRTWPALWLGAQTTHSMSRNRAAFPWTKEQKDHAKGFYHGNQYDPVQEELPEESELEPIPAGAPEPEEDEPTPNGGYLRSTPGDFFAPPSERFICRPEDLCIGLTAEQDRKTITFQVHFERMTFLRFKHRMPLEKLFAADVWTSSLCIFLQGDKQNPILWGELAAPVLPYQTTWRLTSSEPMRRLQGDAAMFSPCLEIIIHKAPTAVGEWPEIFKQCVQAKLMVKSWERGQPRFEGLKGAITAKRAGYDLEEPDFWSLVDNYCHETMKKTGTSTAPRKLVVA
mmetsp:Transcript_1599/g.3928  ORF Transcript_1599/g.3928 Transcript_1599/m.3928 type:complete len:678 (-) Transcript_1599:69-2102(-)